MRLLIDTNVIIDYLADRAPFAGHAEKLIGLCADGDAEGVITASAMTDIYYVMCKAAGRGKAKEGLCVILEALDVAEVGKIDILKAMDMEMPDFEDALAAVCARRIKADCIVTRNAKDFAGSPVEAVAPDELLAQAFPYCV